MTPHPALLRRPAEHSELCQLVADWSGQVPEAGAVVEPKHDGMRALWIDGELVSREGAPIRGTAHTAAVLQAMEREAGEAMFFDGEWVVDRSFSATVAHFKANGSRGDAGVLHLFDAMPMRVWRGEDVGEALIERRERLDRLAAPFVRAGLELVPWAFMTDPGGIEARAAELVAVGGEGVVVKDAGSLYRRCKGPAWQRIRKSLTLDLTIIGFRERVGIPSEPGSLVLDHGGVPVHVRVPAGLWRARRGLLGAVAEVEAMEATKRGSLRQARFVRLRWDRKRVTI